MRRIGGTDMARLLEGPSKFGSMSPYGGPPEVFNRIFGKEEPGGKNADRGLVMEPVLRAHGQTMLGLELEDTTSDYHLHPVHEFAHAQIDDLAHWRGQAVVVDYKSQSRWAKGWGPDGSSQVPAYQNVQFAWEMACADRDWAIPVVGFGDDAPEPEFFILSHLLHYRIERDGLFESHLLATAREFWERYVLPETPPPPFPGAKKKRAKK